MKLCSKNASALSIGNASIRSVTLSTNSTSASEDMNSSRMKKIRLKAYHLLFSRQCNFSPAHRKTRHGMKSTRMVSYLLAALFSVDSWQRRSWRRVRRTTVRIRQRAYLLHVFGAFFPKKSLVFVRAYQSTLVICFILKRNYCHIS